MNEEYDVFISYSRKDYVDENNNVIPGNIVSKVKEALEKNHVKYWFDENGVYSGDEFAPMIARAIKNSKIFLFISTVNSNASDWTSNEIATANAYKKKIIPLRVDNSVFNESVILYIAKLDYIDYSKNPEKAITRMSDSIISYLNNIEEQRKREEEKRKLEVERLKKAEEKERELSHIRKRLADVSKELDSLRSQWQVSSTLYDELKAKEAALLGNTYQQQVELLPEKQFKDNKLPLKDKEQKWTFSSKLKQWFTRPHGKEINPAVSIFIRPVVCLGPFLALIHWFSRSFTNLRPESSIPLCLFFLISSLLLHYSLKGKRIAFYALGIAVISFVLFVLIDSYGSNIFPLSKFEAFCLAIPIIVSIALLFIPKHNGKTFFEQTEPVKENLHDLKFLNSFIVSCLIIAVIVFAAILYARENLYSFFDSRFADQVYQLTKTLHL